MSPSLKDQISVLSDGTGDTAENYVQAILAQFKVETHVARYPRIQNEDELEKVLNSLKAPHLVCYTFASESLRKRAWTLVREYEFTGIDLLYPAVEIFASFLKESPTQERGALHSIQAANYFQKIEAIEFTVKHDDGMKLNEIGKADIVLVGVSRSSKTPTSIYLAHKGYRVANIPLVPGIEPPKELFEAEAEGIPVIFLTISPHDLERIRKVRFQTLGNRPARTDNYIDAEKIREELVAAKRLARKNKWPLIDVTDKAIEETASEVITIVSQNNERKKQRSQRA